MRCPPWPLSIGACRLVATILEGGLINKRIKRSRALEGITYMWKNGEYVPGAVEAGTT